MFDDKEEKHPSFAMLSFSRQQSNYGQVLHGSDLKHSTIIEMQLKRSTKKRGLSHDWHHANERVATVRMSQNQFSELITSMNMGDGIPVTLTYTEKDGDIPTPDFTSIVDTHRAEFGQQTKDVVQDAQDLLTNMKELLSGSGTVKKADREKLIKGVEKVVREIGANMPFMEKSFAKAMDSVVTDAKGTIEAFYQHRVIETGLAALENGQVEAPKLLGKD